MERKIDVVSETRRKATVDVDKESWKAEQDKAFHKLASKVTIKGFRAGKAPEALLREHVRPADIYNEAIQKLLPEALRFALENADFRVALQPQASVTKLSDDDLEFTFDLVLVPSIEEGDYLSVKVPAEAPAVNEEEVDAAIKGLLEGEAELAVVEREAKKGDTIVFDFEGFLPDEKGNLVPFDGGKADGYELELGSHQFVPGFEEAMEGVKAGEERSIEVTFPENYVKDLAGKKATFKTKVHEVKEKKIPALDESTIKGLHIEGVNDEAALRAHEKEELLKKKLAEAENKRYGEIIEKIVALSKFAIDEEILKSEEERLLKNLQTNIERQGLNYEQYLQLLGKKDEDVRKELRAQGEKDLKRYLVEAKVAEKEALKVEDKDVDERIKELAKQYRMKEEDVRRVIEPRLAQYKDDILAGKIRSLLLEKCR